MTHWVLHLSRLTALAVLVATASSLVFNAPAAAWCNTDITKWSSPTQQLYVYYTVPSNWNSAINSSRSDWNGIDTLSYAYPIFSSHITTNFNLFYSDFSNIGWPDVPGGTVNSSSSVPHLSSTVRLNSDFTWNLTGQMDQAAYEADVRTVLTHELGHSSGLHHPNVCGSMTSDEEQAVMHPNWTKKWATNVDDDNGIRAIYP
jgi:hypothetical protein